MSLSWLWFDGVPLTSLVLQSVARKQAGCNAQDRQVQAISMKWCYLGIFWEHPLGDLSLDAFVAGDKEHDLLRDL